MRAVALALGLTLAGCSVPEGFWRDQYVFIGDQGTVMPLGVLRWSDGHAELKGWLGQGGRWRSSLDRRFAIAGRDASSLERTLRVFSAQAGPSARVTLRGGSSPESAMHLRVRTPSRDLRLSAARLPVVGESGDPEGPSSYRAGRGELRSGRTREAGWILVESTPTARPKRGFVSYGDYALVLVASRERGALLLKRSLDVAGFDHAFVVSESGTRETRDVRAEVGADRLRVASPALGLDASMSIDDRETSRGVAPHGLALSYQTLLLSGDYAGVAFLIHPQGGGAT
ncbi:MAG: hypothetical protein GXP55_04215 [Deltaproteobacteria bacterium]|nr:hypothetical protein [Deltaproteobacteria bacterium]